MHLVLIPGLWLDGSAWDRVLPPLEAAGHRCHPLTLPGMEAREVDRSTISVQDHLAAVVEVIDAIGEPVVLVGHSAGAGLAWAAVDARPDRVARAILLGGFPAVSGKPLVGGFEVENGEVALPEWSSFEDEEVAGLDQAALQAFRERAVPSPGRVVNEPVQLSDERRYDVPVTVISTEFPSEQLARWVEAGEESLAELPKIRDVEYLDLDTGHWPMFSTPELLADLILRAVDRA